jgi:hypothetical protein
VIRERLVGLFDGPAFDRRRPLWDQGEGCPCDFIEWDVFGRFRSSWDGRLLQVGFCPGCWRGAVVFVGEAS